MLSRETAAGHASINLARIASFQLGALEVSPATLQLARYEGSETLEPRVMQVLVALWQAQGAVVTRDDLIASCWDGRIVGDNAIHRTISRLRDIAGGIGEGCFRLETVNKVGYRLIPLRPAAVDIADEPAFLATHGIRRPRAAVAAAAGALGLAAVAAGLTIWARSPSAGPITIAVAGRGGDSMEMARGLAADLAHLSNVRGAIAFSEASSTARADYRLTVAERGAGNGSRTDLALLRSGSPDVLWSASFVGAMNLRERAAAAVSMVTQCALDENSDPVRSDAEAFRLVFSGCERLDGDPYDIAVSVWRRIVGREPHNARALATLAYVEAARSTDDDLASSVAAALRAAARAHLEKGRALNGQLGLTYAAEAILVPNSRFGDKLAALDRGVARDPDCAALHALKSVAFMKVGFMNDAVASARKAVNLESGYVSLRAQLAMALAYDELSDGARKELAAAERIWPDSPILKDAKFRFDYRYGDATALIRQIDRGIEQPSAPPFFAKGIQRSLLVARLQPTPANVEAAANVALKYHGAPAVVQNLVVLGRVNRAYESLNEPQAVALLRENTDVLFRSFMRPFLFDRQFMPLAARLGLVQFWLSSDQWPAFCYDKDVPYSCKAEARRLHPPRPV